MVYLRFLILIHIICTAANVAGQTEHEYINMFNGSALVICDTGFLQVEENYNSLCRGYYAELPLKSYSSDALNVKPLTHKHSLALHGSIEYEYLIRSAIHYYFSSKELKQHTEKLAFEILADNKYPLKFYLRSQQSNNTWKPNIIDFNLKFDHQHSITNLKSDLLKQLKEKKITSPQLAEALFKFEELKSKQTSLKNWLADPGNLQKIIEEREAMEKRRLNTKLKAGLADMSLVKYNDSLTDTIEARLPNSLQYELLVKENDSLTLLLQMRKQSLDSLENVARNEKYKLTKDIRSITDPGRLQKLADKYDLSYVKVSGVQKIISNIKDFSVGRSLINYSDLTVNNLLIKGINSNYIGKYYLAFAAGKINTNDREFFDVRKSNSGNILLGRIGIGDPNFKAIILSGFQGNHDIYQFYSDSTSRSKPFYGFSIEGIYNPIRQIKINAEIAKSSYNFSANRNAYKSTFRLFDLKDKSNVAVSIKGTAAFNKSNSHITGYYKVLGENYQSFSSLNSFGKEQGWQLRVDHSMYKNQVHFMGSLRKNDFNDPAFGEVYKSSNVFKSLNIRAALKGFPVIAIGYFPAVQQTFSNSLIPVGNVYYLLNASLSHNYFIRRMYLNTSFMLNRYMQQARDSGMQDYKALNYYLSQIMNAGKINLEFSYAFTQQPEIKFTTSEARLDYAFSANLKFAIGIKYNRTSDFHTYMGQSILLNYSFLPFGKIEFNYDKNYLPTNNSTLLPMEMGRVLFCKYF